MKLMYLVIGLLLIGNASATIIDIVYVDENVTANVYFNNGTSGYYYIENNTLDDDYNTVMIVNTVDDSEDLLENPTLIYDKLGYVLVVLFFAFMFVFAVWIIKKVLG